MVLAIAAIIATALADRLLPATSTELRIAARTIGDGLRRARELAISHNGETVFLVDPDARRYQTPGEAPAGLPDAVGLALYTAQSEVLAASLGGIRFYPDGSSTGGRVRLERDGRRIDILVDWLTGRVRIEEGSGATGA